MFKHLLVPLDGSTLAEAALPLALALAERFDSKVTLFAVTRPPFLPVDVGGHTYAEMMVDLRDHMHSESHEYLEQQRNSLLQQGYNVSMQVVEGDTVAEFILDTAVDLDVDTIVMSTHGRGGFSRWVFGSVADKVLRQAKVPVLLVRGKEEEMEA